MKREILISTPARRYAHAMMEVAIKHRNFMHVLEQLELFQKQLGETPVLRQLFTNPAVPMERKVKILGDLGAKLQLLELTQNFLKTLMHRDRLSLLPEIRLPLNSSSWRNRGSLLWKSSLPADWKVTKKKGWRQNWKNLRGRKYS